MCKPTGDGEPGVMRPFRFSQRRPVEWMLRAGARGVVPFWVDVEVRAGNSGRLLPLSIAWGEANLRNAQRAADWRKRWDPTGDMGRLEFARWRTNPRLQSGLRYGIPNDSLQCRLGKSGWQACKQSSGFLLMSGRNAVNR